MWTVLKGSAAAAPPFCRGMGEFESRLPRSNSGSASAFLSSDSAPWPRCSLFHWPFRSRSSLSDDSTIKAKREGENLPCSRSRAHRPRTRDRSSPSSSSYSTWSAANCSRAFWGLGLAGWGTKEHYTACPYCTIASLPCWLWGRDRDLSTQRGGGGLT